MRVLLVDAFPMMRAALTSLLEQQFDGARVLGVDDVSAAWSALTQQPPPDVMLLDLRVTGSIELMERIACERLPTPVLTISGGDDVEEALHVIGLGAMGYVPERCDMVTLVQALRLVLNGGIYVPPLKPSTNSTPEAVASPPDCSALPLTPRQRDVLRLLTQGLPNKLIARELGLSVETVKDHVAAVLKAMGVSSRTQAVVAATKKS